MSPLLPGIIASGISGHLTPPWSPEGAFDALATINLSTSTASVSFAGIPTGYKHLQIRTNYAMAGGGILRLHINGDTGANYKGHLIAGEGAGNAYVGVPSVSPNAACLAYTSGTTFGGVVTDILDYSNTTKNKVVRSVSGTDRNGAGDVEFDSNVWINTSAIFSLTLSGQNANLSANSQFALYGVK